MNDIEKMQNEEIARMWDNLMELDPGTDDYDKLLSQIMKATDRKLEKEKLEQACRKTEADTQIERLKLEQSRRENEADIQIERLKLEQSRRENESKNRDSKKERIIQIGLFTAGLIVTPIIDLVCKGKLVNKIGRIEQMETFTSIPARSMASWFNFKK